MWRPSSFTKKPSCTVHCDNGQILIGLRSKFNCSTELESRNKSSDAIPTMLSTVSVLESFLISWFVRNWGGGGPLLYPPPVLRESAFSKHICPAANREQSVFELESIGVCSCYCCLFLSLLV